jgi:hypothetical protein
MLRQVTQLLLEHRHGVLTVRFFRYWERWVRRADFIDASPTKKALRGLPVRPAATKIGANVETELSINPRRPGWISWSTKALRRLSPSVGFSRVRHLLIDCAVVCGLNTQVLPGFRLANTPITCTPGAGRSTTRDAHLS